MARTAPLSAEAVQVPAPRGSYLPEGGNNPHPEADLLKMVKRQQRFSMAVAAVVLLALIAIGITVYPRLTTPTPDALPAVASAAAPEVTPRDEPEIPLEVEEFVVEADAVLPVVSEADSPVAENSEPAATAATPVEAPTEAAPVEVAAAPAEETAPEVTPPAEPEQQDMVPQDIGPGVSDTGDEAFANLVAQADALLAQGQTDGALGVYESALALKSNDEALINRVKTLRAEKAEAERQLAIAESLRVRLANVADADGIFIAPDTPAVLLNEAALTGAVRYPPACRRAGVEGRVIVRLVVDAAGQVQQPTVTQGIGFGCDEEVLRVLEGARFQPATFNREPVSAWFMYSLVFTLR